MPPKAKTTGKRKAKAPAQKRNVLEAIQRAAQQQKRFLGNSQDGSDSDDASNSDESLSDNGAGSSKRRRTSKMEAAKASRRSTRSRPERANSSLSEVSITQSSQILSPVTEQDDNGLYNKVSLGEENMKELAKQWVENYQKEPAGPLRDLVNFFIRSCGCTVAITADAFVRDDIQVEALQELQEQLAKLPQPEYPVISRSQSGKRLKSNILDFIKCLIEQSSSDVIYDDTFIETIQDWLTTMSSSVYRPFRHTASILIFKIMSHIAKSAQAIDADNKKTKAQGQGRGVASQRKRALQRKSETLERKRETLNSYLSELFENVLMQRVRDVESIIRLDCIKSLSEWTEDYPAFFADNHYFRYFGWALNDQVGAVRSEALKAIGHLYSLQDMEETMSEFVQRFYKRIEDMALYDVDVPVQINALETCRVLAQKNRSLIRAADLLARMVLINNPRLQKAAAPLFKTLIFADEIDPRVRESSTAGTSIEKWVTYKCLASFLVKNKIAQSHDENRDPATSVQSDESIVTAVAALWDHLTALQDYEALATYLSHDHSVSQVNMDSGMDDDCRLTEEEEEMLVKVLYFCLQHMITPHSSRRKDEQPLPEIQASMSRKMIGLLPRLLSKDSDSAEKLAMLVKIPQLMDIDVYFEMRMEQQYEDLLEHLSRIYCNNTATDVLQNCARTFGHMAGSTNLEESSKKELQSIYERITAQFRDACRGKDIAITRFSDEDLHAVVVSLARVNGVLGYVDMSAVMEVPDERGVDIVDLVGDIVDRATLGYALEQDLCITAMRSLFRYIAWLSYRLSEDPEDGALIKERLERRSAEARGKLEDIMALEDAPTLSPVKAEAFSILIDLAWVLEADIRADLQKQYVEYVKKEALDADRDDEQDGETRSVLISSLARGISVNVIDCSHATVLTSQYMQVDDTMNNTIQNMLFSLTDELKDERAATAICQMLLSSVKMLFEKEAEAAVSLAKIGCQVLEKANQDAVRLVSPQVICECIHIDGVTHAIARASTKHTDKFFHVLTAFAKPLTRARDVAKIHKHIEAQLGEHQLEPRASGKEWEAYHKYIRAIDEVLKRKGLRYEG